MIRAFLGPLMPWLYGAAVVAIGLAGWWLYSTGRDAGARACQDAHRAAAAAMQAEADQRARDAAMDALRLAQERMDRDRRAKEIEDEARMDTGSCRAIDPASLRRLDRRWSDGAAPE